MGRADEALAIQLELADAHRAAGTTDPYVDEEIAACRAALDADTDADSRVAADPSRSALSSGRAARVA